mmetsp:Transcript_4337/g.6332  ORF Transcript_4337/g.6332 Transcript_4337/m.6332 type:complete len:855 (+) Transcript_4337:39-2603(+)
MFTVGCSNEIVNRNSRYEQLLRGEIGGEDIKLIFVDSSDRSGDKKSKKGGRGGGTSKTSRSRGGNNVTKKQQQQSENRREIMAHKAFLHSCGFITAAFTENRFAEGDSGEMCINVPPGTYGAVDALMRWCYDNRCQVEIDHVALERYEYVKGIPALWVLADFLQCQELCDTIIDVLKNGKILRTGMSFAVLVEQVFELGAAASHVLLGAAIKGLPLDQTKREGLETLLDYGGDEMLNALAIVRGNSGNNGDNDVILDTLGEYLAEMKRQDRAKLLPSFFARCLVKFPPATLPEANYANMIIDYITDREESGHKLSESCVMAFLGTVDFGSISRDALVHSFIPRVEKMSPSYALVLNDFPGSPPIVTRCGFSMKMLSPTDRLRQGNEAVVLSCGNILSETSFTSKAGQFSKDVTIFRCPFCPEPRYYDERSNPGGLRAHWLKRTLVHGRSPWNSRQVYNEYYDYKLDPDESGHVDNRIEDDIKFEFGEIESSRLFFDRKRTKFAALMQWVTSQGDTEDKNATSERTQKRSRSDNPSLLQSKGLFVRVLNQCSEIESEKVFFHSIGSPAWRIDRTMEAFRKSLTTIPADKLNHITQGIGFYRYEPNGLYNLGGRLASDAKWNEVGFNLRGSDEELIVARRLWHAGKPVIRIYSDVAIANMEVSVQLEDIMVDALTYPLALEYKEDAKNTTLTWTVDVLPRETTGDHSSILQHKHDGSTTLREYSYLFWEASATKEFRINMSNASCVRSAELSSGLLQDALLAQGLSSDEATEMATHWLPALTKRKFVVIEFLPTTELEKMAKLRVVHVTARIHRVFILFTSSDVDYPCSVPLVRSPALVLPREGCTVVEWGGMECD